MFLVGVLGGAGTLYTLIYLRKLLRKACKKVTSTTTDQLADKISLKALGKLSEVPNVSIRQCARNILTARVLNPGCLKFLVELCYDEKEESVLKACTVIESLTKIQKYRERVIYFGGLEALSHTLYRSWAKKNKGEICIHDEDIQHLASMAIFDLINGDEDSPKIRLLEKNPSFLPTMLAIMKNTNNKEIEKWGLYLIHQIIVSEATRDTLCHHRVVIEIMARLIVKRQGEPLRLILAYQVLVTLANKLMANDEANVLQEIKCYGVIMPMIACLKSGEFFSIIILVLPSCTISLMPVILKAHSQSYSMSEASLVCHGHFAV